MMRETARTKGQRLVAEGRLKVLAVDDDGIGAICRGDSGHEYLVGHNPAEQDGWYCTCEARGRCSHIVALQLVTVARTVKEAA